MRAFLSDDFKADTSAVATFELLLLVFLKVGDRAHCRAFIAALTGPGVPIADLDAAHAQAIDVLASRKDLVLRPDNGAFTIFPLTEKFSPNPVRVAGDQLLKLSRFSYLSFDNDALTIRNPLGDRCLQAHDPALAALFGAFATPLSIDGLIDAFPHRSDARAFGEALADGAMLLPCDADGATADDNALPQRMWEFHDLLFHSRSRPGRSDGPVGATYSFPDVAELPAVVPFRSGLVWTQLPTDAAEVPDVALFDVMRQRRSVRSFSPAPLTISQLGRFLHNAVGRTDDGDRLRRAYPSGGSLYEQSFYIAVDRVAGLERALYVYDETRHRLGLVAEASEELEALLDDGGRSIGSTDRPPALIVITSRFGRVRWKYSGLAYALQLKHVGVIQEAMYLTATALGLGGCAIGSGNTDAFGALAGLDYLEEGALGEFVLGIPELR